jgi:hypothetical protein
MRKNYQKKYERYSVVVQYLNGSEEKIKMAGINTSDYNVVLNKYHKVKASYADRAKLVKFIGVNKNGKAETMFGKEIKRQGRKELKYDMDDIMTDISAKLQLINEKSQYHSKMIASFDKKINVLKHEYENLHHGNFSEEKKNLEYNLKL